MSIKFNLRSLLGGALAFAFLPVNTVVHAAPGPVSADVLVVIDESGSMSGEQRWIAEVVPQLDQNLQAFGVGSESQENHYGLIGFGDSRVVPRSLLLGGELLGNPAEFVQAANGLRVNGGTEDGWRGIEFALDTYPRRSGAVVNIILATDEDRDNTNSSITFNTVQAKLQANRALLNAVVNATIRCADNTSALGMDSTGVGYVADGSGGFTTCTGARAVSGSGTTVANYVNLAVQNGGAVWNLNFLRSGGHYARSFTNALLSIKVEEILNQRPVNDLNAVAQAVPNPAAVAQTITLDGRRSFHQLEGQSIVSWEWDLDNDGIYDVAGPVVTTSFPAEGRYPVRLRVTDDSATPLIDVATLTIDVSSSPLKPTAVAGGPYLFCPQDARWWLDGRGSVNPDDGQGSVGADTDRITEYTWDLNNDLVFDDVTGALVDAASPLQALGVGDHLVRLRVTDNSLAAFPGLVQSNLSDVSITQVSIRDESDLLCNCLPDLAARPKNTKIQLTWTDNGAYEYVVYRSLQSGGPYEQIAVTDSRYSTYLDLGLQLDTPYHYVVAGRGQDGVETCRSREITATPTARRLNAANRAPTFTSTPVTAATEGTPYSYDVDATDPDTRDVITYSLAVAPTGMTIDGNTGLIQWTPINAQVGQHAVTVQASDVQGAFANQSFVITVANVNQAPMIISQPVVSAAETVAYRYAVQAIDADVGDVLSYALLTAPAGMTINSLTGEISWTPAVGQAGAHTVEVQVADTAGAQAQQSFVVQVEAQNLAPSIDSVPVVEAVVGINYQYAVVATDPNSGDVLTFALGAFPDGMTIDTATGIINWVPAVDQVGVHEITVVVSDDRNASSAQAFQLTVSEPNLAPVFTTISLPDAIENVGYVAAVAATDPNAGDQVVYSLVSGPAGLVIDAQTGQINWLPRDHQAGANEVQFRATDNGGLFSDITLSIQVQAVNDAPVIVSLAPGDAQSQTLYRYQLLVEDPDAGDTLTYALVQAPAGMTVSATGLIEWTPPSNAAATYPVQVTVTDAAGLSDSQSFTLSVINRDPVIVSIPLTGVPERQLYTYQVIAQDDDGDTLSYAVQNAPGALSINAASGLLQWQTQAGDEGSYPVIITASDNRGGSATQNITITIEPPLNAAPVITSTPVLEATEDAVYTYQVQAQDSDQDALVFTLASAPQGMSMSTDGLISWTPVTAQIGSNGVTVQVSDGRAQTTQSFTVVVNAKPNLAPQITSAPATSAQVATEYQYQIVATDPESDALTFSLMSAPAGMTISVSGLVSWTPAEAQLGSHGVTVRVTDTAGNYSEQSFSIAVIEQPNATPVISSTPSLSVVAGALYQYALVASDADGDALQYSLIQGPSAASVSGAGLLVWQTAESDVGNHAVVVRVTDSRGAYAEQNFTLVVSAPVNLPPVISSVPVTQAVVGQLYAYTVVADDPENAPLTLTLLQGPAGLSMTAFGDISWTPLDTQIGTHAVQVQVSDGTHAVIQGFSVTVAEEVVDTDPLDVAISVTPQIVAPGESVTIQITAFGGNGVPTVQATLDGGAIALVNGTALVPGLTTGTHTLQVRVSDSRENFVETRYFSVSNPGDSDAPVAQISTTNLANAITAPVNITGTATDSNLAEYRLLYSQAGKNAWLEFAREITPVNNGTLAQLDPTVLENGTYDLLLLVRDVNGRQAQASASFSVDGDFKVGEFSFSIRDLGVPMLGLPIEVNRSYDTRRRNQSLDFGYGWSVDYQSMVIGENQRLGLNWTVTSSGSGFFRTYCVVPVGPHYVTVTRPDGRIDKFNVRAVNNCSSLIPPTYVDLVFEAAPGTQSTLTADLSQQLRVNGTQLLNNDLIDVYDPDNYTLTTKEGLQFRLSQSAGIQWVADRAGNRITFSRNGIAHSAGKSIVFSRDGQGRITRITDPDGNAIRYEYDGAGNLARVIDREGNLVRHTYNRNHGLVDIIDPLGRRISRNIYDDAGRLIAIEDADGNRTAIDAEVASRTKRITDPLGNARTIEYDVAGNPVREVDENGNQTLRTFNALGYLLSETDAAGNTRSYTYDSRGNRTSETDELGNVTSRTFDDFGNVLTVTNALGQTTTYAYDLTGKRIGEINAAGVGSIGTSDSSGNLLSITDSLGNTTSYVRDAYGQATAETDANGTRIDYAFDANGNQTLERVTVPDGSGVPRELRIERAFDANGNVILVRDAAGNEKRFAYDGSGNLASETDANGFTTAYEYDAYGRRSRTLFADGTSESRTYDSAGRVVSETDRLGRVTTHAYNAVGNRIRTEYPDGSSIASTYDAVGRVLTQTDERGNVTTYEYDAKGRRTAIVNALGQRRTFVYDAADNVILETDALGRQTTYAYDAGNRQVLVTFPDGVQISKTWDQMNRPLSQTNGNGHVTQYEYDAYGRLTSVTNPLGDTTRYEYLNSGKFGTRSYSDEVGAKTAQIDALGRRTHWQIDALGRPIAQVRPNGSADATTYDGKGNVATYRDYLGNTTRYEYNAFDQLTRQTLADGSSIRFAYAGNMLAQVDDQHGTTHYGYDLRDRLVRVDFADGRYVQYGYDATGNRTAVETATGLVNYSYDALNRLVEVDDPDSGVTRYEYNAAGELIATRFANGNSELREYNPRGELTAVRLVDRNNAELAVSRYTLDGAGNRLAEVGLESRESYAYDANGQLLRVESVTSGGTAVVEYAYDAVGNRVAVTEHGSTLTSVYNNLDQLVTDGSGTYRYDANGNLIEVGGGAGTATLDYDLRGRLVRYQEGLVSEEYEYDHAGRRIAKISGGVEERYLLDVQVENAQVVEAQTGAQTKRYVYGLARIAEAADGQVYYFHHDGLGSTRSLTSEDGALTDVYQYSAFGELRSHTGTSANEFLFAGEQRDGDSGLYYLRARYYNPETGRFTQVDPFQGVDETPLTLHDYEYAGNNPILLTDPSGRIWDIFLRGAQISRYTSIVARINFLLRTTTRGSVTTLRALKRSGQGIWRDASRNDEVHHIIEKRLLRQLGFRNVDDTPGIVLPREVHQIYTQRWMQALPRRGQTGHMNRLTTDDVINAAYKVYHDSPVQLRELLLFLL